ncbi:type III secretion system export apparatus subunit SctR [Morganella psychrotolerans]|uniref:EscR/YscR/HrcR family type III secretion system export apparatus protein n=1 Tax=Morganella psychrotolerans TaxID=368603 RepID=A0A5M9RAP2_9GAMM|nr:type III secretion system export apparatus subunit SctR [Morganella psychrotolerans]KAA8717820.1 EscR/YscR/HrcR family type III secretion system export apparatus protein [Morganella psychrotolerans]OBU07949.1 EscR/YscR/HrcR family type III secretion system export apparatus protein [Morganella psychrotolerans]
MNLSDPLFLIALLAFLSFIPVIIVTGTAFIKIGIVFSLLRNAIGIQQIPSNLTMHSFALILTLFVMGPTLFDIKEIIDTEKLSGDPVYLADTVMRAGDIYSRFLIKNTAPESRQFFQQTIQTIWPEKYHPAQDNPPFYILLPSFTLSELISAFKIGFLLYLPFLAIDFIISNILLAMGMMMVSPMTISLPLKLLLFIMINGWEKLIRALLFSYHF